MRIKSTGIAFIIASLLIAIIFIVNSYQECAITPEESDTTYFWCLTPNELFIRQNVSFVVGSWTGAIFAIGLILIMESNNNQKNEERKEE